MTVNGSEVHAAVQVYVLLRDGGGTATIAPDGDGWSIARDGDAVIAPTLEGALRAFVEAHCTDCGGQA
jgi:hypothetical protein